MYDNAHNAVVPAAGRWARVTLYTHLNVREDALDLYGFYTQAELNAFKMLIGVSGVGPKSALAILSDMTPDKLALCIAAGDSKSCAQRPVSVRRQRSASFWSVKTALALVS